jgi:hypothetical protein
VSHWSQFYSGHRYFFLSAVHWIVVGLNTFPHLILTPPSRLIRLGFAAAYFSYHQYYPPLHAHDCHAPFEPRHHVKLIPDDSTDDTTNADTAALGQNPVSQL